MSEVPDTRAYVAIGSNISPKENIPKALELLDRECPVIAVSAFYSSPALDRPDQALFINGVCLITTRHTARSLKYEILRGIEFALGRVRGQDRYAARPIDLDIALYGGEVIQEPGLVIPDPDIEKRPFVAVPLMDLDPDIELPGVGVRICDTVAAMDCSTLVPETAFTQQMKTRFGK